MFNVSCIKRLCAIVCTTIALLIGGIYVRAVNSGDSAKVIEMQSSVEKFGARESFNACIKNEFKESKYYEQIDYSKTVSVVASPAFKLVSMEDIKEGAIVGGLYLSSGSLKYNLPQGAYAVNVIQKGTFWFAQFVDKKGDIAQEVTATVYPGKEVKQVLVSLSYSICYIINGAIVCI